MIDEKKLIEELNRNSIFEKVTVGEETVYDIINRLPKVGEWIPCSENPKEEGSYIVAWMPVIVGKNGEMYDGYCQYKHYYGIATYYEDGEVWDFRPPLGYKDCILLAWCSLPAPYNADMRGEKNE